MKLVHARLSGKHSAHSSHSSRSNIDYRDVNTGPNREGSSSSIRVTSIKKVKATVMEGLATKGHREQAHLPIPG